MAFTKDTPQVNVVDKRPFVSEVHTALAAAVAEQKPDLWSRNMTELYCIMSVGYLVSTMSGFDGSLMGSLNAMKPFQETFGLTGEGSRTGLVFIMYNFGQMAAFPFCGFLSDGYGRRVGIFVGCLMVLVGTVVQASANAMGHFMAGRLIMGFGASIAATAAPAYVVELAHPAYRGFMAGMYNNFWWLGNILAGWTTYGSNLHLHDSWAWRVPTIMQAAIPLAVASIIMFFPESPRWLVAHGRHEEALAIFAKYHGDGNPDAAICRLEYHQVMAEKALTRDENPWWDLRELFHTRAARYRFAMVIGMGFFGQWSGNNVVSYFMPAMIIQAGITDTNKQLLINAINPIFCMLAAVYGASLLDRLGRRPMLLWGLTGALCSYVLLTVFTAQSAQHPDLSYGVIAAIYLFGVCFAWSFTPLQTLYPTECLENRTRLKGSGLNFLFLNVAIMVNMYGISVGIEAIGWKLYLIYDVWIVVEWLLIYFFFVETAGKTLEELGEIFEAPNPRKASTQRLKVEIDEEGRLVGLPSSGS